MWNKQCRDVQERNHSWLSERLKGRLPAMWCPGLLRLRGSVGKSLPLLASVFWLVISFLMNGLLVEPCSPQGFLFAVSTYIACQGLQSALLALAALVLLLVSWVLLLQFCWQGSWSSERLINLSVFIALWVNGRAWTWTQVHQSLDPWREILPQMCLWARQGSVLRRALPEQPLVLFFILGAGKPGPRCG